MTINKQESAIKVAGAVGCNEDADGWTTHCALTPWIPAPGIKPEIPRGETSLLSPRSLLPTLPNATSPAGNVDTCPLWGARTGECQSHGGNLGEDLMEMQPATSHLKDDAFPNLKKHQEDILLASFQEGTGYGIYFAYLYLLQPKGQKDH